MAIGIDIGGRSLKVIRLQRGLRGIRVTGASRVPLAADALLPALEGALKGSGRGRLATVGISGREVNLQYRAMPPVAPFLLRTMVQLDLQELINRSGGDSYADWTVIAPAPGPQGETIVLAGLAKQAYVEERLTNLEAAGVRILDLCPASLGLFAAHANFGSSKKGERVLLMDIGSEFTQVVVAEGDRLLFTRTVSAGGKLFTDQIQKALGIPWDEAEQLKLSGGGLSAPGEAAPGTREADLRTAIRGAAGQLASILQSSIAFARGQLKREELEIHRIRISGGAARLPGFADYLQATLERPVEAFRPLERLDLGGLPAEAAEELRRSGDDLTVALGLAAMTLRPSRSTSISLLPDLRKKKREFYRRGIHVAAAAVVGVATLGILWGTGMSRRAVEQSARDRFAAYEKELTDRAARLDAVLGEQKALLEKQALLEREVLASRTVLEALAQLRRILPERLWLSRVTLTSGDEETDLRRRSADPAAPAVRRLVFRGLTDETSLKDPKSVLQAIAQQLQSRDRGVTAQAEVRLTEKAGILEFILTVAFEGVPAPKKAGE